MVRVVLLDEDVAVEAVHVLDTEDADAAERACGHRQDLTLCDVGTELCVSCRLQTIDGSLARSQIAFERSVGHLYRQSACHDALEAHVAVAELG